MTTVEAVDPRKRYSRQEVARILNVSYNSVSRLVQRGEFPEESHLRVKRILGKDLKRYIRDVRAEAKGDSIVRETPVLRVQKFERKEQMG